MHICCLDTCVAAVNPASLAWRNFDGNPKSILLYALTPFFEFQKDLAMPVTIFVWSPHGNNVGHASLALSDGTYVSWWPDDNMLSKDKALSSTPMLDQAAEASGSGKKRKIPDWASAPISGLEEDKIREFWKKVSNRDTGDKNFNKSRHSPSRKSNEGYHLLQNNCSKMVLKALQAGGLEKKFPQTVDLANARDITPLLIKRIAQKMTGEEISGLASVFTGENKIQLSLNTIVQYAPCVFGQGGSIK